MVRVIVSKDCGNSPKSLLLSDISVHPDSKEEADRIFKALSAGGSIEMQIADQPWGDYWGSFKDKFGVQWMVDYGYPKIK